MRKLVRGSPQVERLLDQISDAMYSCPPSSLGYPGEHAQSAYYPGEQRITQDEIAAVDRILEEKAIFAENTRIRKTNSKGKISFEVLQASTTKTTENLQHGEDATNASIRLAGGDHSNELLQICSMLAEGKRHASSDLQQLFLSQYIESFKSGSLGIYRDSQKAWIQDKTPRVENIFGFVEPYRDPFGVRAEFEGLVAIRDREATDALKRLIYHSDKFIRRLPWTEGQAPDGAGALPFEKKLFEPPALNSMHGTLTNNPRWHILTYLALAYCSSIIFPGINLPNACQMQSFRILTLANPE